MFGLLSTSIDIYRRTHVHICDATSMISVVVYARLLALWFLFTTINHNWWIGFILGWLAANLTDFEATDTAKLAVLELTRRRLFLFRHFWLDWRFMCNYLQLVLELAGYLIFMLLGARPAEKLIHFGINHTTIWLALFFGFVNLYNDYYCYNSNF